MSGLRPNACTCWILRGSAYHAQLNLRYSNSVANLSSTVLDNESDYSPQSGVPPSTDPTRPFSGPETSQNRHNPHRVTEIRGNHPSEGPSIAGHSILRVTSVVDSRSRSVRPASSNDRWISTSAVDGYEVRCRLPVRPVPNSAALDFVPWFGQVPQASFGPCLATSAFRFPLAFLASERCPSG